MSVPTRIRATVTALARRGGPMALGTAVSRLSGLGRTLAIASVLASGELRNAYTVANAMPNLVYELVAGGALAAVVVPLLVREASDEVAERLLSLVVYLLVPLTVLAVAGAGPLVSLLGLPAAQEATVAGFARLFMPQILFYGVSAMLAAVLNARRRFAVPLWAPVVNNLVVIAMAGAYALVPDRTALAIGTTAAVGAQMAVLGTACVRAGFRPRLHLDPRGIGLRALAGTAAWTLFSVAVTQVVALVTLRLTAGSSAAVAMAYALFQVPYALVAVTAITGLLPRMSRAAARRDLAAVTADLSRALRATGLVLVPVSAALFVAAPALCGRLLGPFLGGDARLAGTILAAFALSLVPFAAFQIMQRVFFALGDTRTPALLSTGVSLMVVALSLLMPPGRNLPVLLAGVTAVAYTAGALAAGQLLRGRLGRVDGRRVVRLHAGLTAVASAAAALYVLAA